MFTHICLYSPNISPTLFLNFRLIYPIAPFILNCALYAKTFYVNTFVTILDGNLCALTLQFATCHVPYGSVETSSIIFHLRMFCVIIPLQLFGYYSKIVINLVIPLSSASISITPLYSALFPPKIISQNYLNYSGIVTSLPMEINMLIYGVKDAARFTGETASRALQEGIPQELAGTCLLVQSCVYVHSS